MKIGIEIKVDVTKIPRERIYVGKKGKYISLTSFVNLGDPDEYGNNGPVTMARSKEEPKDLRMPIIGNVRIFYRDGIEGHGSTSRQQTGNAADYDEIPF
jgi:hypothetical protein